MFKPKKYKPKLRRINEKRARLIIRNLPFCVTEEALKKHFESFGTVKEINILKRSDGKLVGCGFLQFAEKQSAAKAIYQASGKLFMGRVIIVDWAIPKDKFIESKNLNEKQKKQEAFDICDNTENSVKSVKREDFHYPPTENDLTRNNFENSYDSDNSHDSYHEDFKNDSDNSHDSDHKDFKINKEISNESDEKPKPRIWPVSHDISEGKTVFLRNVPFNINNAELKEFMEKIGPVIYAVICIDPLTEHSRGTAFVKFKNKIHADQCLELKLELKLNGTLMQVFPALEKKKIMNKALNKHPDKKKDNRNLYLVKEGVVVSGTSAAIEVSMADIKKRLELEVWKSNMLKNLNMFISKTRLIIHNLPLTYDDSKLRSLFKKYAPPKSRITEAKVMKNLRILDKENKPVSKGYGFVSFTEHEHALEALRKINNNPSIFNKNKRPIVAFSIENRAVLHVKQKRMQKSKAGNFLCPPSKKPAEVNETSSYVKSKKRIRSENVPSFAGIEAHPGHTKLMSKHKILTQEEIHRQNLKQSKKNIKKKQSISEIRREKKKEPKVKSKKQHRLFDKNQFSQLVQKYKQQIMPNNNNTFLKKWYEKD